MDLLRRASTRLLAIHRALLALPFAVLLAGAGCVALAISSDLANSLDVPRGGGPLAALATCAALVLAFAAFVLATRDRLPQRLISSNSIPAAIRRHMHLARWLVYPLLLWAIFTAIQTGAVLARGAATAVTVSPPRYGSDDLYYNHYNAWLVLHGQNPYVGEHLAAEVRFFGATDYTPIARGRFADVRHYPTRAQMDAVVAEYLAHPQAPPPEMDPRTTHSYPAGAFLADVPAVALGLPSIALPQIALFLALIGALVWATPPPYRAAVALLALATADGARQVAGSDFEIWPLALVGFAWLARDRRWLSAILLGLACTTKQTAWLAAAFYLVWVWRTDGFIEAVRRAGIAASAFLIVNLPWIVMAPGAWLTSLLLPVSLPLLPDGSGLVGLSLASALPLAPSWVYGLL
ncbi:MAG TPA: hypothetical protein VJQ45_13035, partial [Ktedonobacterales bacterium]|nr:hypothetical protein [Ktedonobacterales bacterium]